MPGRIPRLVMAIVFLLVGGFISYLSVLGLLAYVPGLGTGGKLPVAHCSPISRGGVSCTGTFTTPDGEAWGVRIEGIDRAGVTVDATVYPWDDGRAYARGGTGSVLRSAGGTVFGCVVLAMGVFAGVTVLRGDPRTRRRTGQQGPVGPDPDLLPRPVAGLHRRRHGRRVPDLAFGPPHRQPPTRSDAKCWSIATRRWVAIDQHSHESRP